MKQHQPSPAPKAPKQEGAGRGHRLQPGPDPSPVRVRSPPRTGAAPQCCLVTRAAPRARATISSQATAQEELVSWHRGWMEMERGPCEMAAPCSPWLPCRTNHPTWSLRALSLTSAAIYACRRTEPRRWARGVLSVPRQQCLQPAHGHCRHHHRRQSCAPAPSRSRAKPSACPTQLTDAAPRSKAKGWRLPQGKRPGAG